ncbi:MAG: Rieske 2Fe-2S domain-containing protein [Alphaproteobacteria bacterium]|nr:Rieske 2Fe-2S domain-containing protein [Alphaproteobacteria bacterium]
MWTDTGITRTDLHRYGRKLVRKEGKQILLLAADQRIFAIANRCPHEGYPLSEGTLGPGCLLTCNWHNWKFDLATGEALVGRDPVRTYPVETRGDVLFVDVRDPPAELQRDRALAGLGAAMQDNDAPRIAREVTRLERAGFDARIGILHAFDSFNDRLEDGMNHAHAAGADWLALSEQAHSPEERLAALLEPLGHLSWDTAGGHIFPYCEITERWTEAAYLDRVEAEDEPRAISRMRGALAEHVPYPKLRPVLAKAALAHYADFGHSAIYTFKAGQLIDRLGDGARGPVLLALTRQLVKATREERLPEFRSYAGALKDWDETSDEPADRTAFLGLSIEECLRRLSRSAGRPVGELYESLLHAAAWNLLHFDIRLDRAWNNKIADNVSWLDFTHALTFANATRHLCADSPELWPQALLQLALFVGRNAGYIDADQDIERWSVESSRGFIADEKKKLFDHGIAEPIIACHRLKVLFALEDELDHVHDENTAALLCAAVNRYLNVAMKRHHGLRVAAQALDFIAREA